MLRKVWLLSAAALLQAGAARAADVPVVEPMEPVAVPSFSWSGGYVGVQGGYDWFDASNRGRVPDRKPDGFTIGGFAGFNHQFDNSPVVIGAEADINYSDAKSGGGRFRSSIGWTGAVRGRVGYAFDRFLIYGAAGVAVADHDLRGRPGGSDDTTAVGWTIGGGVEAAITDNVTARVEYRYSDFGTDTFSVANTRVKSDVTDNRVLLGLGYKFSTGW